MQGEDQPRRTANPPARWDDAKGAADAAGVRATSVPPEARQLLEPRGVEVPLYAVAGGRVNVSCMFDLGSTGLYSLKWYHNDTEFYRFVPTETHRSVDIKPTIKFQVHEVSRTDRQVTLSITSMTSAATGEYKCEVIAEHPSFRTETDSAIMTVLDETPSPPVITGTQELYEDGDIIKLRCLPESIPVSGPSPSIMWFIQGRPARREYVSPYREDTYSEESGKILQVPATQATKGNPPELFPRPRSPGWRPAGARLSHGWGGGAVVLVDSSPRDGPPKPEPELPPKLEPKPPPNPELDPPPPR
ncbi:hypothetical protein C7M84_014765 [Penaeus vannamei]|uniref:Ig-like domain-containing protein n=1 Tax=Penaeus vannamei TaxID=6689 RepID=A0A423SSI9_PENVA|nr:hypothetical protein C7M84_014765 [Penaeus vannamei]